MQMDLAALVSIPLDLIESFAAMPYGMVAAGALLALLTATFTALSVPGTIIPMSFTSGALLGFSGVFVIALGALGGSVALFLVSRYLLGDWIRHRLGDRLDGIGTHLDRRGPFYVVAARITGIPGLLVTAGSAVTPISARTFGAASLLGMMPAIVLAAMAGSAI